MFGWSGMKCLRHFLLCGVVVLAQGCGWVEPLPLCEAGWHALRVTELMIDPEGVDAGAEWIEVFNASDRPQPLGRLVIDVVQGDSSSRFAVQGGDVLAPGAYAVLGSMPTLEVDTWTPMSLRLPNGGAEVILRCAEEEVDRVRYGADGAAPAPLSGVSLYREALSLAGDEDAWCLSDPARLERAATPGAANAVCDIAACVDGAGPRYLRAANVAQVWLSEVLPDPAGADAGREWVELYVAVPDIDLNNLRLVQRYGDYEREWSLVARSCTSVASGSYVTLSLGEVVPSDTQEAAFWRGPSLANQDSVLQLWRGGTLLDVLPMQGVAEGSSVARHGEGARWRDGAVEVCTFPVEGDGQIASPGSANGLCGDVCFDGDRWRPRRSFQAGEVQISEVFPDPEGPDDQRDWLELHVLATDGGDLSGVALRNFTAAGERYFDFFPPPQCWEAKAGARLVVAGAKALAADSASFATLTGTTSTLLYNQAADLELFYEDSAGSTHILDRWSYPKPLVGRSYQRGAQDGAEAMRACWSGVPGENFVGYGTPGFDAHVCVTP